MKVCPACKLDKPISAFNKHTTRYDGVQAYCRECTRISQNSKYRTDPRRKTQIRLGNKNRILANKRFVWEFLSEHPCVDCGENDPVVLEFDHHRDKKSAVSNLLRTSVSLNTLINEMEKCSIRCANCHRRKTAKQLNWYTWTLGV